MVDLVALKKSFLLVISDTFQMFLLFKVIRIIDQLYFLSVYLTVNFFLLGDHSDFGACQSFFGFVLFSANFFWKYFFFLHFISPWASFRASLYIFQSILKRLVLIFLDNWSLKLHFSSPSLLNHVLLVIFILTVFKPPQKFLLKNRCLSCLLHYYYIFHS